MDSKSNFHSGIGGALGVAAYPGNAVGDPVRQPEITAATEELRREIDTLHELLCQLEQRLNPIIRCQPQGMDKRGEAPDTNVPFANTLRALSRDVSIARDRVTALLETVAL